MFFFNLHFKFLKYKSLRNFLEKLKIKKKIRKSENYLKIFLKILNLNCLKNLLKIKKISKKVF